MPKQEDTKTYVLVVAIKTRRPVAYGPFATRDEAEYAAMDHYGTAITGASWDGEFLIAELHAADPAAITREHDRHIAALLIRED